MISCGVVLLRTQIIIYANQRDEVNWVPQPVNMWLGAPNNVTQFPLSASTHSSVEMFGRGTMFIKWMNLSITATRKL